MNAVAITHNRGTQYATLGLAQWVLFVLTAGAISLLTKNGFLTFVSLLSLPTYVTLLWRVGEPPILFFAVVSQWTQAVTKLFDANIRGITVEDYFGSWTIDEAIFLNILALLCLSIGMRVALRGLDRSGTDLADEVKLLSINNVWTAYVTFFVFSIFAAEYIWFVPRLAQILLVVLSLKWVLFFILGMAIVGQGKKIYLLVIATIVEVVIGITGFFSGFHQVFLILLLVSSSYIRKLSWKTILVSLGIALILLCTWIFWSAVKVEFRNYLNQGTGQQRILVPWTDRTSKIIELYSEVDEEDFLIAIETFAHRVSYVDYFARVLEVVPEFIPHTGGEIWGGAIMHVLTPRILFPDKKALVSDTLMTGRYTQTNLIEQGGQHTSVPLGYLAESYIDFGRVFMFAPVFLIGVFFGLIYRYFLGYRREVLFGFAITVSVLLNAQKLETGALKLVGGVLMAFIVMALIRKLVVPGLHRALRAN